MKRLIALLLAMVLCLGLCACGASKEESALMETKWVSPGNGDVYTFAEKGSGSHDSASITYKTDGTAVTITEGGKSATFTLDLASEMPKLTSENGIFYVREADYDAACQQLKQETCDILTSCEFWTAVLGNATNYVQFSENGTGWFMLPGWTLDLQWEYIDMDTVKVRIDWNGGQTITLDVVGNNGNPQLINAKTGVVTYVPKQ